MALANNRDLRVAVLNIEQARAQFQVTRAALFPASASAHGNAPAHPFGRCPEQVYARSDSVGSASPRGRSTSSAASTSLKEAALAQYLATEESRKAAQISLVAAVARPGWLADDELLEITRQTLVTREESRA